MSHFKFERRFKLNFVSVKCAPGTYSENGVEPCVPCAKGSYQSGIGALSCVECTGGKSTYGPGADSADMCVGKIYGKLFSSLGQLSYFSAAVI